MEKPAPTSEGLPGVRIRQQALHGHVHVIIAVDPKTGREMEVFAQIGKAGSIQSGNMEAICRMVSLFLRGGGTLEDVMDQLEGIGSDQAKPSKDGLIMSNGDALGKAIRKYLEAKEKYGLQAILMGEIDFDTERGEARNAQVGEVDGKTEEADGEVHPGAGGAPEDEAQKDEGP